MKKIAYFDCFSGISGDMCLGALISAGVNRGDLERELAKLPVEGYSLRQEKVTRNGIAAVNVFVERTEERPPARHLDDIERIIDQSTLPGAVKVKSKAVFNRLARAEAAVHGVNWQEIHFHEVGAVDAIVDIIGTVSALSQLGVDLVYASPLPVGRGFISCSHGILPSPAPATLEILREIPIYGTGIAAELVTPTGAALIATLADGFCDLPAVIVQRIGYGAGNKIMEHPNLLRVIVGNLHSEIY